MAAIKAYTDLEQSKKLAEILPLESADMCYKCIEDDPYDIVCKPYSDWKEEYKGLLIRNDAKVIPCWSLAALLDALKDKIIFGGNSPEGWFCCYTIKNPTKVLTIYGDSLVDACYELILKLHELGML